MPHIHISVLRCAQPAQPDAHSGTTAPDATHACPAVPSCCPNASFKHPVPLISPLCPPLPPSPLQAEALCIKQAAIIQESLPAPEDSIHYQQVGIWAVQGQGVGEGATCTILTGGELGCGGFGCWVGYSIHCVDRCEFGKRTAYTTSRWGAGLCRCRELGEGAAYTFH